LKGDGFVNLRSGPGAIYPIVGRVQSGTSLVVLARSEHGEWLLLEYPDTPGGQAWVYAAYTDYQPSLHPLPVATAAPFGVSAQEPAVAAPGLSANSDQASAIEKTRSDLELPTLPLTFVEMTNRINSPTGNRERKPMQREQHRRDAQEGSQSSENDTDLPGFLFYDRPGG